MHNCVPLSCFTCSKSSLPLYGVIDLNNPMLHKILLSPCDQNPLELGNENEFHDENAGTPLLYRTISLASFCQVKENFGKKRAKNYQPLEVSVVDENFIPENH